MVSSQNTRKAINSILKVRMILILSWTHTLVALVSALILQFSGRLTHDSPQLTLLMVGYSALCISLSRKGADSKQFNTSEVGLSAYYNFSSPLHDSVRELVPSNVEDPSSITNYLGIFDWYSISFYWSCRGYYTANNATGIFNGKIEVRSCETMQHGHTYSLRESVKIGLTEQVKPLANDIPDIKYNTGPFSSLWLIGWVFALLNFVVMPFSFRRQELLGRGNWCIISIAFAFIATIFLFITVCLQDRGLPTTRATPRSNLNGKFSRTYLLLGVSSTVSMFFSFWVGIIGWGVGVWLENSMPLSTPDDVDEMQDELGMAEA